MSVMDGCEPENDLLIEMFYLVDVRFLLTSNAITIYGIWFWFAFSVPLLVDSLCNP